MEKKSLSMEEVMKLKNIYPIKRVKIPLIEEFKNGKPIFSEKPFYTYSLIEKDK
jgi:hypothetical protein